MCRGEDRIYRLGGDEFLILTISMPQDVLEARLRDRGDRPEFLPERAALNAVKVGFSFETASARIDVSLDELIASADRTLSAHKTRRVRADEALSCVSAIASIL